MTGIRVARTNPPAFTDRRALMKKVEFLTAAFVLGWLSMATAQKLPGNLTCQDLIDVASGKASRSNDGGKTYVPINKPQLRDAFDQALLSHDTFLCKRLSRGEITVDEFNALHNEKAHQLRDEKHQALVERQKLENQQRALQNQEATIQAQREAARLQAVQAEVSRRQQQIQHQQLIQQERIQQQQLEQIRQQQQIQIQQQRQGFTCFGSGNMIHCN
jgi:hypothetical protein